MLSTDNRDNWAKAYDQLTECHKNCKNIKIIQKSLFTVSLDQEVPFDENNKYEILGKQLIHGGGLHENSANRWMDKTIQVRNFTRILPEFLNCLKFVLQNVENLHKKKYLRILYLEDICVL